MNRYRPARRSQGLGAGPLIAFLLICSFGFLFVGCSRQVRGPNEAEEDITFTKDDIARFSELETAAKEGVPPLSGTGVTGGMAGIPRLDVRESLSGSAMSAQAIALDLSLLQTYASIRRGPGGGANVYRVTNPFLKVRSQPGASSPIVANVREGDTLTFVEFPNAAWAKVQLPGGGQGYVASRYISKIVSEEMLPEEEKKFAGLHFVDFKFVNVRKSPDTGSEKLGEIAGQEFVKPLSMDAKWARIIYRGKEGYVSTEYLSPFQPHFLVRQEKFTLPILHYHLSVPGMADTLLLHTARLKQEGMKIITMRDFYDLVLAQEQRDVRLDPRSVVIAVTDITPGNVKQLSDALYAQGTRATLFLATQHVGLGGITEKLLLTLQANGFDIQSAAHTGDDLRSLTNAQLKLELEQSRKILEDMTRKTVFAADYPQGGANDRVTQAAAAAGYLFGIGATPDATLSRDQFLRLPSFTITSSMTAEDVLRILK